MYRGGTHAAAGTPRCAPCGTKVLGRHLHDRQQPFRPSRSTGMRRARALERLSESPLPPGVPDTQITQTDL